MEELRGTGTNVSKSPHEAAVHYSEEQEENQTLTSPEFETPVQIFVFSVFGFILQIFFSVGISASQDILEQTLVPTAVLLISASLPFFLITCVLPYFVVKVPPKALLIPVVCLSIAGVLLYALVEHVLVRIIGVVVVCSAVAIGEVMFVSLSAFYSDSAMSAYATGTGVGFIVGPLYYAAMTTIICVPPQTTILAMSWIPLLMLVGYAVMVKSDQKPVQGVTTHTDVTYTSLLQESTPDEGNPLSWKEKRELIVQNIHLVLAFAVGYFSEFVTLNAVVTTIAFPNSPFDPRSHYVYYACVFMIGEFIGRSYLTFLSLVKCSYSPVLTRTWILSAIIFSLLVFLTLSSWYRFVHSVWIVLALCFLVGVLAGSLYLNTFLVATAGGSDDIKGKAFSRAFLSVGPSAGVLLAGVVGLALEPALRRHCLEHAKYGEFCFTRSMTGWNKSTSCLR